MNRGYVAAVAKNGIEDFLGNFHIGNIGNFMGISPKIRDFI